MKNVITMFFAMCMGLFLFAGTTHGGESTNSLQKIISIETRDTGYHSIYLDDFYWNSTCDVNDRAIIVESDVGGKALLDNAFKAFESKYIYNIITVKLRVEGCVPFRGFGFYTAPKIVAIRIFR
ncbi:hypothetical protein ACFL6N_04530 [Thermodesulfobacteriota bacterium]